MELKQGSYIEKEALIEGVWYAGFCRNAYFAVWNGKKFLYIRRKFGSFFMEEISHPDDEKRYDVFWPVKELEPPPYPKLEELRSDTVVHTPEIRHQVRTEEQSSL